MTHDPLSKSPIYDTVPNLLTGYNSLRQPVPKSKGYPDYESTKLIISQPEPFSCANNTIVRHEVENLEYPGQSGVENKECCAVICCGHSLTCK